MCSFCFGPCFLQFFSTWQATVILLRKTGVRVIMLLKCLQLFPILKFKSNVFTLVYRILSHLAPGYLSDLISFASPSLYSTPTILTALSAARRF